jgi:hypothetical protein
LHDGWQHVLHEGWLPTVPQAMGTRRGCGEVVGVQSHDSGLRIGPCTTVGLAAGVAVVETFFLSPLGCESVGVVGVGWSTSGAGAVAEGDDPELILGSDVGFAAV